MVLMVLLLFRNSYLHLTIYVSHYFGWYFGWCCCCCWKRLSICPVICLLIAIVSIRRFNVCPMCQTGDDIQFCDVLISNWCVRGAFDYQLEWFICRKCFASLSNSHRRVHTHTHIRACQTNQRLRNSTSKHFQCRNNSTRPFHNIIIAFLMGYFRTVHFQNPERHFENFLVIFETTTSTWFANEIRTDREQLR